MEAYGAGATERRSLPIRSISSACDGANHFKREYGVYAFRVAEYTYASPAGDQMVGLTPVGRATVQALHLNRPLLLRARQAWVQAGWHPPDDEQMSVHR